MNARGQVIVVLYIGTSGKSNSGKNARGMENYLLSAETWSNYPKICETKVVQKGVVEQIAKPSPLGPTLGRNRPLSPTFVDTRPCARLM